MSWDLGRDGPLQLRLLLERVRDLPCTDDPPLQAQVQSWGCQSGSGRNGWWKNEKKRILELKSLPKKCVLTFMVAISTILFLFDTISVHQWFPTFFSSRTPLWFEKEFYDVFIENICENLILRKIWSTPWDFSRTPGREPLFYSNFTFATIVTHESGLFAITFQDIRI